MTSADYSYHFSDVDNSLNGFERVDHQTGDTRHLKTAIQDQDLLLRNRPSLPAIVGDILDIAQAVYIADRLSPRKDQKVHIHVEVPVREAALWETNRELIQEILYWQTRDDWTLAFTDRTQDLRLAEQQLCLPLSSDHAVEVALWSGGLDSLAGAVKRLLEEGDKQLTLVSSGSNNKREHLQKMLAENLNQAFPNRAKLIQIPVRYKGTKDIRKNRVCRTRGFLFMMMGAAVALSEGQTELHIYENGIGAINLPFRSSQIGVAHSRAVHPYSMSKQSELITNLIGSPFKIRNPFLFHTKAQMCEVFQSMNQVVYGQSLSCDRPLRDTYEQCGWCSSCLLRRQALSLAQVSDPTRYHLLAHHTLDDPGLIPKSEHLRLMLRQVNDLRIQLTSSDPWLLLTQTYSNGYLPHAVDALVDQDEVLTKEFVIERLLDLYARYVQEWDKAVAVIGEGLLSRDEYQAYIAQRRVA